MTHPNVHHHAARRPEPPPLPARGADLSAVRAAWRSACLLRDPRSAALDLALRDFARDGRARGASVGTLLRTLDALVRAHDEGDAGLDDPALRAWAGTLVIRSYYRDA